MSQRKRGKRAVIGAGLGSGLALVAPVAAQAADFTVTNLNDTPGPGSLRAAISSAEAAPGADRVVFQAGLSGTITLGSDLPTMTQPTEIVGPGAGQLTVDANGSDAFYMFSNTSPMAISALTLSGAKFGVDAYCKGAGITQVTTISGMTFTDNHRAVTVCAGLNVSDSSFIGNHSDSNAAATSAAIGAGGPTTIAGSRFVLNSARASGGAVYLGDRGPATITGSTFTGNVADSDGNGSGSGGALISSDEQGVSISSSTFTGNRANFGGAAFLSATPAPSSVDSSTFVSNVATGAAFVSSGGGIFAQVNGSVSISNSTITGNTAATPDQFYGGGGLFVGSKSTANRATINDSTISGNVSASNGGGVLFYPAVPGALPPTFTNTIISGNSAPKGPDQQSSGAAIPINLAFSVLGDPAGVAPTQTGPNLIGVDPKLGPLADNGGPTQTMALTPGSPAIDAGVSLAQTDQRGSDRVIDDPAVPNPKGGNGADIGAYEVQAPATVPKPKCAGKTATIVATKAKTKGTKRADVIVGRKGADKIFGLGGNDTICGLGGNDRLYGGKGKDRLIGAAGRDKLFGGPGRDKLAGGPGKDQQKQ